MKNIIKKFSSLETIEQRSFWILSPLILAVGILYIFTIPFIFSNLMTYISAFMCALVPVALMVFCKKTQNYNLSYPLLCIAIGAIVVPITFAVNGGFYSGMPICCTAVCFMCAFCYSVQWRYISFITCLIANFVSFSYVDKFGASNQLIGANEIEFDIIVTFAVITIGVYIGINFIVGELRNYVVSDEAMKKFMDANVRNEIVRKANHGDLNEKGEYKDVTVMFVDISSFTSTTESMPIEKVTQFLNIFLTTVERNVHANGGIIDKYIGDCAMAYWINDGEDGSSISMAINAVNGIKNDIIDQSGRIQRIFNTDMKFQASLDIGPVILGSIGSENRKDFTIIGDTVNTASRIESVAKSGEFIISSNAAKYVNDSINLEEIKEEFYLKGKEKPIKLFKVLM